MDFMDKRHFSFRHFICFIKWGSWESIPLQKRGGGVGQGDPLSPLLFVLATDLLQSLINKAKDMDLLRLPINVGYTSGFPIIQYADDTFLIMESCIQQLFCVKDPTKYLC
jgi:hypothetical protein